MTEQQTKRRRKPTPKRIQPRIRHEVINAADYRKYALPWACEDCSHYNPEGNEGNGECSFGYNVQWHQREFQKQAYALGGNIALCRFQEID